MSRRCTVVDSHTLWLCVLVLVWFLGVEFHGQCAMDGRICVSHPSDSNVCEVFRVEATGKEDKENAKCAYDTDAVG